MANLTGDFDWDGFLRLPPQVSMGDTMGSEGVGSHQNLQWECSDAYAKLEVSTTGAQMYLIPAGHLDFIRGSLREIQMNVKLIHDKQQKTEAELELVKACNTKLMTWTIDVSTTLATMEQLVAKLETEVQQVQSLFR